MWDIIIFKGKRSVYSVLTLNKPLVQTYKFSNALKIASTFASP